MTKIITRYFGDAAQVDAVTHELFYRRRFAQKIMQVFYTSDGAEDALKAAHVSPHTAAAYAAKLANGGAVLLVKAGFRPLGVAATTREVTAAMGAVDMGDLVEEVEVEDTQNPLSSILQDHPLLVSRPFSRAGTTFHMANWPIGLISRRKPFSGTVIPRHMRMSSFPIPLLMEMERYDEYAFPRHARMANFPIPLLSDRKPYTESMIEPHGRMANFPLPLISRRIPSNRTWIGRHTRMANWPVPHLINAATGTNALMPGGPRMANFPINLLSPRKPFTGSIFSPHARMANFPLPLLSKRKPYTGSVISRHGRMADMILPLVIRRDGTGSSGWSLSRLLGLETLSRRK